MGRKRKKRKRKDYVREEFFWPWTRKLEVERDNLCTYVWKISF